MCVCVNIYGNNTIILKTGKNPAAIIVIIAWRFKFAGYCFTPNSI